MVEETYTYAHHEVINHTQGEGLGTTLFRVYQGVVLGIGQVSPPLYNTVSLHLQNVHEHSVHY